VDERGINVSSVTGGIDLDVRKGVNADLVVRSLVGYIRNEVSDVTRSDDSDYEAVIGSGGGKILFESIVGSVDIRRGR
jgi:DUF4097 and DUF4098 domain-containing protein YvlB